MTQTNDPQPLPQSAQPVSYETTGIIEMNPEARQWGMFAHLSALAGLVVPFGSIIGPLIVWQVKKEIPFVDDQGKEALNFHITVAIALVVCVLLMFVLIGFLLLPIVGITALVFSIIGGVRANNGERYRYPMTIRFIR